MADSTNKIIEIQKTYQNATHESFLYCLRRKLVRESDKRSIFSGVPDVKICDNRIQTSKYNYITFLPKNLLVQFSKLANIYFIIIGICQIIPQITTTDGKPLVYSPLAVVIIISMVKDFIEDRKRRKQDEFENKSIVKALNINTGEFEEVTWETLRIGDIIQVKENERFPADILVLSTTGKKGSCYIETKNLDGETNLKHRQSCAPAIFLNEDIVQNLDNIGRFQFKYEDPNPRIHSFNGIMQDKQENDQNLSQFLLSLTNICLRGCALKKTHSITGIVIYSGHDCKSLKYANRGQQIFNKINFGTVEKTMNRMVVYVFAILLSISIFCASYYIIWYDYKKNELAYLHIKSDDIESNPPGDFFLRIPMWILLLNTFVPISLLVTLEIVKYLQGQLLSRDKNFTNNLSSELVEVNGSSIKYILTDKTGTLTGNVMKFKALSLNNIPYEHTQYDDNGILRSKQLIERLKNPKEYELEYEAFLCMNLCHELIIEEQGGKKVHSGTSADEECIMEFCIETGIYFESVDEHKVMTIFDQLNKIRLKFKVISLHEYRSDLRKMSVLVQDLQTMQYKIYQKGSMQSIFDCCRQDQTIKKKKVEEHLNDFASNMLRTLCLSYRILTENEVLQFLKMQREEIGKGNLNLQEMNDQIFSSVENQQILIGGTGVNDEFGDQVVPTLQNLKKAGIKIWMITGDKRETALSIGIKSGIVEQDTELKVIEDEQYNNDKALLNQLSLYSELMKTKRCSIGLSGVAFQNINGANNQEITNLFNSIMKEADSIIAFHFTPRQKQQLVELVHIISPGQSVLSIGDGANDVNMLQTANVGIGIRGKEGREAAKASDFSIAEFKHLNRLLLYVGQEAYRKNSYLILFNFYKNQAWNLTYFWFNFYTGQSAQYIYDQWLSQFFNLFYVSIPIIIYALFDEIHPSNEFFRLTQIKRNLLESRPEDYKKFTNNLIFQQKTFWKWFFYGSFHGLMTMFISFQSVGNFSDKSGRQLDIFYQGMHAFSCCVILGNLKVLSLHKTHYFLNLFFIYASIAFYFSNLYIASKINYLDSFGIIHSLFSQPNTYFGFILLIIVTYGADSAYEIFLQSRSSIHPSQEKNKQEVQLQLFQQSNDEKMENNKVLQNKSDSSHANQNYLDYKNKKDIENSSVNIKKKLLTYPIKSFSIKDENMKNSASSNQLAEEPYFDEDNVIDGYKKETQSQVSQNPLTNKLASPSGLMKKAERQ